MTLLSDAETIAGPSAPGAITQPSDRGPALEPGSTVGRYVILSQLGVGGMGVVSAAYDPELDRKIAIKLLHRVATGKSRDVEARLIREAQAIAKLHHPNVITVHDVGIHERRVFVAMEFVDGGDLGEWMDTAAPRPWREVVAKFLAAGRGLAGAHRAGLVHRDFKPANVLLGSDGRVVVADFGLARESDGDPEAPRAAAPADQRRITSASARLTQTGSMLGTPAYMAPEQYAGARLDARADQFSFCVALYEALYGERPFAGDNLHALMLQILEGRLREPSSRARVPGWLRKVVVRGLANDPDARWSSMDALLDALEADPGQRLRRLAAIASFGLALTAAVMAVVIEDDNAAPAVCTGAERAFAETWTADDRARIEARFATIEGGDETLARLLPALDDWAGRWRAGWIDACEAQARGEQSDELLDRRMFCLERRRRQVATYVELLGSADAELAGQAIDHFEALAELERCADAAALLADVPPPEDPEQRERVEALTAELDELLTLVETHELDEAEARLDRLAPAIAAEAWRPLTAEFDFHRGQVSYGRRAEDRAERELRSALAGALAIGDERLAFHAILRLTSLLAEWQTRYDEAFDLLEIAGALAEHLDDDDLRAAALRSDSYLNQLRADYDAAVVSAEQALELMLRAHPPDSTEVARARYTVAMSYYRVARAAEALAEFERAREVFARHYGPNHTQTFMALNGVALLSLQTGEPARAVTALETLAARREALLGPDHLDLSDTLSNLGIALSDVGDHERARAALERALAIRESALGPDHLYVGHTLGNLVPALVGQRDYAAAEDAARRTLAIVIAERGEDHHDTMVAWRLVAEVEVEAGKIAAARADMGRALALAEEVGQPRDLLDVLLPFADIAVLDGEPDEALGLLARAEASLDEAAPTPAIRLVLETHRARAYALLDRDAEARAHAEAGLRHYEQIEESARVEIAKWLPILRELAGQPN